MTKRSRRTREELRRAILRIEHQRPKRVAKEACHLKISIVAREAGLTPATIHNCYPDIAELIRAKTRSSKVSRTPTAESRVEQLVTSVRRLKDRLRNAENDVARIASENAKLLTVVAELRTRLRSPNEVGFNTTRKVALTARTTNGRPNAPTSLSKNARLGIKER